MSSLYMLVLYAVVAGIGLSITLNIPGSWIFVAVVVGYLSSRLGSWYVTQVRKIEAQ